MTIIKKRFLSMLTAIIMIIGLGGVMPTVSAGAATENIFAGGDGSAENPYQVSTPEQLNAVRNDLSAHYVQINDIDMSDWGYWEPIGTGDSLYGITPPANPPRAEYKPFIGEFSGQNYKIKNINIFKHDTSFVDTSYGLFAAIDRATIRDVQLLDLNIDINKSSIDYPKIQSENGGIYAVCVGGIAGKVIDSIIDNCVIGGEINVSNCYDVFSGGVCGTGKASNCVNNAHIYVDSILDKAFCGGVIGETETVNSKVEKCVNLGSIVVNSGGFVYAGGITGEYGLISDSVNLGSITGNVINPNMGHSSFAGICNVGGINGANSSNYIKRCINYAQVSAFLDCSEISNYGDTYSHGYAGGIVGFCGFYGNGSVDKCYSLSGNVSCIKINNTGNRIAENCGRISGFSIENINCFSVIDCFVNGSAVQSSSSSSDNGQDLEKALLLKEKTYLDFDFINTWKIDSSRGGPVLRLDRHNGSSNNPQIPSGTFKQLYFEEPITILNIGETRQLVVHSRDAAYINGEWVYSNDQIVDSSELVWNSAYYKDNGIIKMSDNGQVTALKEGIEYVLLHSKNDVSLGTSCRVFVGNPNEFSYTATYDTKQYYAEGGFFSETSSVSDCVELYLLLENKFADELKDLTDINGKLPGADAQAKLKDIAPITLTAKVSGNDLSFSRDSYTNTYSATFDSLSAGKAFDDILMLFPHNLNIAPSGNTYTVKVTLKSDSFDAITEQYAFKVENLETKNVNEHIEIIQGTQGVDYRVSKHNIYGEKMLKLKGDPEYVWSKFSTFDFKNYYQIVLADIMIQMLNANQVEMPSLVPAFIKDWVGTYKTLLNGITTIVDDKYASKAKIDKWIKSSKYETDGIHADDELYQTVLDLLGNVGNAEKITKVFAAVDKTKQVFGFVKLGKNIFHDAVEWGNKISLYNTYADSDAKFKEVMKTFAETIPNSERGLKEAVNDYVNYSTDKSGQVEEILESFAGMFKNVTLDLFKSTMGKGIIQYELAQLATYIGDIKLVGGMTLSATTLFGSVTTGISLGLCLSDVLCDSSGKAEEMGKVVAVSEFSPYVIDTLNKYESKLYTDRNDEAVDNFEYAFALHKATQSYIMEHTVKALETKRDSIIVKLFNRDDYDELISDVLAQKSVIDNLKCHNSNNESTVVTKTKVLAIKCPVDVFIYDENGHEVVRIKNDKVEYIEKGINIFVENGEKYIALPANQEYSIKIIATDSGKMEYIITEYSDGVQCLRTIKKSDIPLENQRVFTGEIAQGLGVETDSYALKYNGNTIVPSLVTEALGDLNSDGKITTVDVGIINSFAKGTKEYTDEQLKLADANKDGKITTVDVGLINKIAKGV